MLLLFDIDGTLMQGATAEHSAALHEALHEVHGITDPPRVEAAGRTDGEIARNILLLAGVSAQRIDARADDVRTAACEAYARLCPGDLRAKVAPGIPALLDRLSDRDGVTLALVTGNYEPIARLKLRRAGIGWYFPTDQGGFGSDDEERAALPGIARTRAGGDSTPFPRNRTIVIGDTPRDIACARADGVRVLAVATGPFAAHALTGADAVARDAQALTPLLLSALDGA